MGLPGDGAKSIVMPAKRRVMSVAARKRIAAAQKRTMGRVPQEAKSVSNKLIYRSEPTQEVDLFWESANPLNIRSTSALYLLKNPRAGKILYIGKAGSQTIRDRWLCRSKDRIAKLARKERIRVRPLVAGLHTSRRLTSELVNDVERLLIFLVQPRWNRMGMDTCRLHHRELVVNCSGKWPLRRYRFSYLDDFPSELRYRSEQD